MNRYLLMIIGMNEELCWGKEESWVRKVDKVRVESRKGGWGLRR